ncbi:MAG: dienelactone hydrolase family protein [Phycisphaeraceae bacterium]|nr:dienelactone hydrolase family protein [Phycisphaeraceae bacterium]
MPPTKMLIIAAGLFCAWPAWGQTFAPGQTTAVEWKPTKQDALVYLPTDYTPDRLWPVVVFFHGTTGEPTVAFLPEATGGKGFILVGIGYVQKGKLVGGQAAALKEYRSAAMLLGKLHQKLGVKLDPKRIYLAGVSKGGWIASLVAERELKQIAGALIFGAGMSPRLRVSARKSTLPKPLFIGVGVHDPNVAASRAAIKHFRRLGAEVTFDSYPDTGHDAKPTDRLRDWFTAESLRSDPAELAKLARQKLEAMVASAKQQPEPLSRYLKLQDLMLSPWFHHSHSAFQASIKQELAQARSAAARTGKEWTAQTHYQRLYNREIAHRLKPPPTASSVAKARAMEIRRLEGLRDGYARIVSDFPGTDAARRAADDHKRLNSHLAYIQSRAR